MLKVCFLLFVLGGQIALHYTSMYTALESRPDRTDATADEIHILPTRNSDTN